MYENQRVDDLSPPLPPGSMGWPLIGETYSLVSNRRNFYKSRRQQNKSNIFKSHLFGRPVVIVTGLENVKHILQADWDLLEHEWPKAITELLGPDCLSSLKGNAAKERRKIILTAFKHNSLSHFVAPMRDIIQATIRRWVTSGEITTHPEIKRMTFEVASKLLVGFQYDTLQDQTDLVKAFDVFVAGLFTLGLDIPGSPFNKGKKARLYINDKIAECIHRLEESPNNGVHTVLSILLAKVSDGEISREDIRDEIVLLLFAGHDTTACALTMAMMYCAKYPEVVTKLRKEISDFELDEDVLPTYDLLNKLPYVNSVMREVLMQQPPVGGGYRVALKSFQIGEYQVPKGWKVCYSIDSTHQIMFSDSPFNPDRWMKIEAEDISTDGDPANAGISTKDGTSNARDLYFGGGSKSCVGKEFAKLFFKVFLVEFVRLCDIKLINEDVKLVLFPTPKPSDGMPITVKSRIP